MTQTPAGWYWANFKFLCGIIILGSAVLASSYYFGLAIKLMAVFISTMLFISAGVQMQLIKEHNDKYYNPKTKKWKKKWLK